MLCNELNPQEHTGNIIGNFWEHTGNIPKSQKRQSPTHCHFSNVFKSKREYCVTIFSIFFWRNSQISKKWHLNSFAAPMVGKRSTSHWWEENYIPRCCLGCFCVHCKRCHVSCFEGVKLMFYVFSSCFF